MRCPDWLGSLEGSHNASGACPHQYSKGEGEKETRKRASENEKKREREGEGKKSRERTATHCLSPVSYSEAVAV